jgi:hypothetical protein
MIDPTGGIKTMLRWLFSGFAAALFCLACADEGTVKEPATSPDAGRRFVEQESPAKSAPAATEAKPLPDPVDAVELHERPASRQPLADGTDATEDVNSIPAPPPAGIR